MAKIVVPPQPKIRMPHLVIFLPGVMGSVLQKDKRDLWAFSGQAITGLITSRGKSLHHLIVKNEDGKTEDLGDGIHATRIIEDVFTIPGFIEHVGYSAILQELADTFDLVEGSIEAPTPSANYFPFPYDWRRDNRVTAAKLKAFIDAQLPAFKEDSGNRDAKVILIGHSMGGVIARYYVECCNGWRTCQTLLTIGSPHRGSVGALTGLCNGIHPLLECLNPLIRSFESAYQLLPAFPGIRSEGSYQRLVDLAAVSNLDMPRAKDARTYFLQQIVDQAEENKKLDGYRQCLIPWVGVRQGTLQSAEIVGDRVVAGTKLYPGLPVEFADGDGTVPRISASPPDLEGCGLERYSVEQHGWLPNNPMTLAPMIETLKRLVSPTTRPLFGDIDTGTAGVSLNLEHLYTTAGPVHFSIGLATTANLALTQTVRLEVRSIAPQREAIVRDVPASSLQMIPVELGNLLPGLYQLSAAVIGADEKSSFLTTHGTFEVLDPHLF